MFWLIAFFAVWAIVYAAATTSVAFSEDPIEGAMFAGAVAAVAVGVVWLGNHIMQAILLYVS